MSMATPQKRRKKYQPQGLRRLVRLTERDIATVRLTAEAHFLRTDQIGRLLMLHGFNAGGMGRRIVDGQSKKIYDPAALIKDRLTELFHGELLFRPRAGFVADFPGSERAIYTLGRKGPALLREHDGENAERTEWVRKAALGSRAFIEHTIACNEFSILTRESIAKRNDLSIDVGDTLLPDTVLQEMKRPWRFRAHVMAGNEQTDIGVVPDLGLLLVAGEKRLGYLTEICRGTEPCVRYRRDMRGSKNKRDEDRVPTLVGTSILRKLLAYSALKRAGDVTARLGWRNFKVLFVCEGRERGDDRVSLMQKTVARFVPDNRGLFLFADREQLEAHSDVLSFDWVNWQGEPQRIDPIWVAQQMKKKH